MLFVVYLALQPFVLPALEIFGSCWNTLSLPKFSRDLVTFLWPISALGVLLKVFLPDNQSQITNYPSFMRNLKLFINPLWFRTSVL